MFLIKNQFFLKCQNMITLNTNIYYTYTEIIGESRCMYVEHSVIASYILF